MNRTLTETVGGVEVTLIEADDLTTWTVVTRWLTADGGTLTTGRKRFTGDMADVEAAAFGNQILFEEWRKTTGTPRPVFAL